MLAYRHNHLVYIPITKHASTSYSELFGNILNWSTIQTDSINWEVDHVFAHLINPYTRHLKGITECLKKYDLRELVHHEKFLTLLGTAVFDLHSYPLAPAFGQNFYKVDWLLLDHHTVSGDYLTVKFLKSQGIDIVESDIPKLYATHYPNDKQLLDKISEIRDQNDLTGTLTYFYEQDVILYGLVNQYTRFCEIDNLSWQQCSWLNNCKEALESPTLRA
jgi:hypothetical protein